MIDVDAGVLSAIGAGVVSIVTTFLSIRASARRLQERNDATIHRVALEQSQAAFASVREEIDRLRADNDRLRADNDRLAALVRDVSHENARLAERIQHFEAELAQERAARAEAEALVAELRESNAAGCGLPPGAVQRL